MFAASGRHSSPELELGGDGDSVDGTQGKCAEAKLDPTLELPPYRDNFESRLILLKRRLDEQDAPIRIHATGRGRFDLEITAQVALEHIAAP